jgi:hypothetical protein
MTTRDSLERLLRLLKNARVRKVVCELKIMLVFHTSNMRRAVRTDPITADEVRKLDKLKNEADTNTSRSIPQDLVQGELESYPWDSEIGQYKLELKRKRRRMYTTHIRDQRYFLETRADVELLAEALRSLPALKSITTLDLFELQNPPLGSEKFHSETSLWPASLRYRGGSEYRSKPFSAYTVSLVLRALIQSNIGVETLNFCKIPYQVEVHSMDPTRRPLEGHPSIPASTLTQAKMGNLKLSTLKRLAIEIWTLEYALNNEETILTPTSWFVPFISQLRSVQSLNLSTLLTEFGDSYLHLLGHADPSDLPRLHTLELTGRKFSSTNIHNFINRFSSTLQRLIIQENELDDHPVSALPLLRGLPCMSYFQFGCVYFRGLLIAGETVQEFQSILGDMEREFIDEFSYSEDSSDSDDEAG